MVTTWTDVPKPTATSSVTTVTFGGGDPIGLLLGLTYSSVTGSTTVLTNNWTNVPKAT